VLRQVEAEVDENRPAARAVAPPLTDAIRAAILTEGTSMAARSNPAPVVTELSLSVREPYRPEGKLIFNDPDVVDTQYNFARIGREGSLYLNMDVEQGQRYLLDYTVSLYGNGTLHLTGGGVNKREAFRAGSHHFLTIIEAPFTGTVRLYLRVIGADTFDIRRVEVSRLAQ